MASHGWTGFDFHHHHHHEGPRGHCWWDGPPPHPGMGGLRGGYVGGPGLGPMRFGRGVFEGGHRRGCGRGFGCGPFEGRGGCKGGMGSFRARGSCRGGMRGFDGPFGGRGGCKGGPFAGRGGCCVGPFGSRGGPFGGRGGPFGARGGCGGGPFGGRRGCSRGGMMGAWGPAGPGRWFWDPFGEADASAPPPPEVFVLFACDDCDCDECEGHAEERVAYGDGEEGGVLVDTRQFSPDQLRVTFTDGVLEIRGRHPDSEQGEILHRLPVPPGGRVVARLRRDGYFCISTQPPADSAQPSAPPAGC